MIYGGFEIDRYFVFSHIYEPKRRQRVHAISSSVSLPMKAGLERVEQETNLSGAPDKKNTFLNESVQTTYKDMRKSRKGIQSV